MNWVATKTRLPHDEDVVLVAADGEVWVGYFHFGQWRDLDAMPLTNVTHWADFPEAPAGTVLRIEDSSCPR
jgi:hypothetical protein